MLPHALSLQIQQALQSLGEEPLLQSVQNVRGGCINHGACLTTKQGFACFLKWNSNSPPGMFSAEAKGLNLIASTHTIRVPSVLYVFDPPIAPLNDNDPLECPAFILLEWIQGDRSSSQMGDPSVLGERLAALHTCSSQFFGLDQSNYLGSTPQLNNWSSSWVDFYRENRLGFQYHLADRNHLLPASRRQRLEKLMANLDHWLEGDSNPPSLLHGDLWAGNCIAAGGQNEPVLIDPAVYYGHREVEIAYTELFGGFDSRFYSAYQSVWPLGPDYNSRKDLYNLYHLLNHLNLFGEAYAFQVDAVLRHYVG